MKFLVSGGAGFIGSTIVKQLLNLGHTVAVVDNFSTGKRANIAPLLRDIRLVEGDIADFSVCQAAVSGMDVVLHEAATPSVPKSIVDPFTSCASGINGTLNLLEAARQAKVNRFVFASSSSVYGDSEVLPKTEQMMPRPMSPYAVTKITGEYYCSVYAQLHGMETVALRYFNVFGPNQDPTSEYAAVIPKFLTLMKAGKQPLIFGDGSQTRDFTYIDNIVAANILAAEAPGVGGMVFNCACGEKIVLNDVVRLLNEYLGTAIEPVYKPERPGDIKHSHADVSLIIERLGFKPGILFAEGLKKAVALF